jgi:DNA-binding transcriptional ArsR family regulator
MYQFSDPIDYDHFFRFDKWWIKNMNWALLRKSSKSILPVIAMHCDEMCLSYPGERTIAILAGLTDKTVREGIQGLNGFPGFEVSNYISNKGKRAKKYRLAFPSKCEKGRSFFFHRCIVEGGNWQELKQISHALYPVMRYFAYFEQDIYVEKEKSLGETASTDEDFKNLFKNRKWDICEAEITILAKYTGISRPSVYEALEDLEKHYLIERLGLNGEGKVTWKVFLIPPKHYRREYLNTQIAKRYKSEIHV